MGSAGRIESSGVRQMLVGLLFAEDRGMEPNELHVYISRLAGKPLYVTTTSNGRTWLIQDGRIQGVQGIPSTAG